ASVDEKASRFVIAAFLFNARFAADESIENIPWRMGVHEIIAKYINTKRLMEERIQPAELLEFFDDNTEEYNELTHIFDYNDGNKFIGEVAERYFYDCIKTLRLSDIDDKISRVKALAEAETDGEKRKSLAEDLQKLLLQKKNIKNGERR
ncbi:MAG: hypothetical protein HDP34_05080, partial [Clostridia bacterium]|nr:hypothetical protein [Clostridia bacterium]